MWQGGEPMPSLTINHRGIVKQALRFIHQLKSVTHSNETLKRNRCE